jgi:hypothetical protein
VIPINAILLAAQHQSAVLGRQVTDHNRLRIANILLQKINLAL